MQQSHKVLVNTIALYIRIIANSIVILFSTRVALEQLGVDSFGLYNLIAGVISVLSFFTGALTVSSQRFLSIAIGEGDENKLNKVFNISILVHIIIVFSIIFILKIIEPFLFNGFLNIQKQYINDAKGVYNIMILSSAVTIFTIPFNASINAREEMWFSSLSDIISIVIKLLAAISLFFITTNKLFFYSLIMVGSIIIGSVINIIWCKIKYKECKFNFHLNSEDKPLFNEMFSFAGWNTLGSLAVVMRNQGIAVVLNIFFGTVINAAYGVANQLNSLVITFASTLTTVFTPMIVQAKGAKDDKKMIFISIFSSKLSFFLSSLIAIPVLINTDFVIGLWLEVVPANTVVFCKNIIITFLIMQLYPGITRAIYATGKIKWYQISISLLLISNIPIGYYFFSIGLPPVYILYSMILAQILTLIVTIYYASKLINLNVKEFVFKSIIIPFTIFLFIYCIGFMSNKISIFNENLKFTIVTIISVLLYVLCYYLIVFSTKEKLLITNLQKSIKHKIFKND